MDHEEPGKGKTPLWVAVLAGVVAAAVLVGALFVMLFVTGPVRQQIVMPVLAHTFAGT